MHWLVWQCKTDTAVYHDRLQLFWGVSLDTHTHQDSPDQQQQKAFQYPKVFALFIRFTKISELFFLGIMPKLILTCKPA